MTEVEHPVDEAGERKAAGEAGGAAERGLAAVSPAPATPPDSVAAGVPRAARSSPPAAVRQRGYFEVRWRQFRRAPTPVVRAVISSVAVAGVLGILLLVYDLALDRGARLPGGDLRVLADFVFVAAVAILGASITYVVVPQPGRPGERSRWSAALGLFAALPIAYLALVLLFQVIKPILVGSGA